MRFVMSVVISLVFVVSAFAGEGLFVENTKETPMYFKVTNHFMVYDGNVKSDYPGGAVEDGGTMLDLHRQLGHERSNLNAKVEFGYQLNEKNLFAFRYNRINGEADWGTRGEYLFDHIAIPANSKVHSSLLIERIGARYHNKTFYGEGWSLWTGLGVDEVHLRMVLNDLTNNQSDVEDVNTALDFYFGLHFKGELSKKANIHVDVTRSLPIGFEDITFNNASVSSFVEWKCLDKVSVLFGYAYEGIDIEDKAEDAPGINIYEVNGRGIVVGALFKF